MDNQQLAGQHHRHDLQLDPSIISAEPDLAGIKLAGRRNIARRNGLDYVHHVRSTYPMLAR